MQKVPYKQGLLVAVLTLSFVGSAVAVGQGNAKAEDAQTTAQDRQITTQQTAQDKRDAAQTRLADTKLKACQKRETVINNIMTRIATRGEKQIDVFNKIAERTEAFYVSKGKTLSNYDDLVAAVNAKKVAAQTTVDAVKSDSVSFKCDGTDPKGVAQSIKDNLKKEIAALKDYKTAIKNLIVGVKSVQGSTTSADNKNGGQ